MKITNPAKFIQDTGILGEINRTILHPLGLALAVNVDAEEGDVQPFSILETADPEGFVFDEVDSIVLRFKAFSMSRADRVRARGQGLGHLIQKPGGAHGESVK